MLYCSMISILSEIPRESIVLPYFPQIVVLLSPPSILEIIFRNNELIMTQQYNTGISNRKTKKKIRIFDLKLWWRSNLCLGYNGIFRSRLFFFSKIHTLDKHILFIYYTCKLFYIRISSLKNIITPGKIFSKKRGRMIDLSWFTERATLLLSYSSIVGWNIGKKKKKEKEHERKWLPGKWTNRVPACFILFLTREGWMIRSTRGEGRGALFGRISSTR